ncbi:hypothetical protein ACMD2_13596 [Ananas comosus]|uniref:Transmembrane protein n=1 Tax=Ananas comosus TaxID=4615 RepID=A0A199V9B9_ANACO|nr:hypothetical protein ACMD2_13596 [Ananas comosus]
MKLEEKQAWRLIFISFIFFLSIGACLQAVTKLLKKRTFRLRRRRKIMEMDLRHRAVAISGCRLQVSTSNRNAS